MSSKKWLNCRLVDLQIQLSDEQRVTRPVISRLLRKHKYSLKANIKTVESKQSPERDKQFQYIYQQRQKHQNSGNPVISVDTKKKELIGNFKNTGRSWCLNPEKVNAHDFPQEALGRAVPYGIYDLAHNQRVVYLGRSADTPTFAVENIAHWCQHEMQNDYPQAKKILIEADGGGSNSSRSRVFKQQLQEKVANPLGLIITVSHYPTGTSKWNPIEHRLFSEISKTWAGYPLRSYELMAQYIENTTTATGLNVKAHHVTNEYLKGVKVSDDVMGSLNLIKHEVCPQWNYTIYPQKKTSPD